MSETVKHTPGPWEVRPNYNSPRRAIMRGNQRIAVIGETSLTDGDPGANARLIAAAPDLLFACRIACRMFAAKGFPDDSPTWLQCEAAIAKATP